MVCSRREIWRFSMQSFLSQMHLLGIRGSLCWVPSRLPKVTMFKEQEPAAQSEVTLIQTIQRCHQMLK